MNNPPPTHRVLDPNQPNPDKVIADAARAAFYAIRHMYITENVLTPNEDALVLALITILQS